MERFEAGVEAAEGGARVVTVRGELDLAAAERLWEQLEPLLTPGALVVFEGTQMTFLDSSGLRVLLQAHKRAESEGAAFRVVAPQAAARRVLQLAGADKHLQLRENLDAALVG